MPKSRSARLDRRQFLRRVGAVAGVVAAGPIVVGAAERTPAGGRHAPGGVLLVHDPDDPVASSARWAADLLRQACTSRGLALRVARTVEDAQRDELCIVAAGSRTNAAQAILERAGAAAPDGLESLALVPARHGQRSLLLATAPDALGLAYALTELADRVECAAEPMRAFALEKPLVERPTCRIRSAMRVFASDVEDLGWYHDRDFWRSYLDMLVTHRFNRVNLALGVGYDFARQLRDTYFYFAYPFLVSVPGYDVRASGVSDAERERNLETLRFVSAEAARRGLHFQLGLWTHAFEWTDSPHVNHTIEGLTREHHAAYCRDALRALLAACPDIHGLTIRTHGESGVPEGDPSRYEFWRTLLSGIPHPGRALEIDLHAKGVDQKIIDLALETGVPVRVSPKFWAEHMGLPYLQSSIRALELPKEVKDNPLMVLSTGERNHMRYSYGDLMTKDRRYGIVHRVWPGTQRLLLWGEPTYAAQMGRAFSAFGADGVEYMEPLSFKGRKGSGLPGGRDACADPALRAPGGDWRKYIYTYRLWGRLAYDPDAPAEVWRRQLQHEFGKTAVFAEQALASASRILPLVSSAHCPSAANNNYWPEMYTNMSLVDESRSGSYSDTPAPKVFGQVSSLDPQLFASVEECADALQRGEALGKITPLEVAHQLDEWSAATSLALAGAFHGNAASSDPRSLRLAADCAIVAALGRFFAAKFRAGVLFGIFDRSGDAHARTEALVHYRRAREAWVDAASRASAYVGDVTFGFDPHLRGHWRDRLPAIDRDIAALEAWSPRRADGATGGAGAAVAMVLAPAPRRVAQVDHTPRASFEPGRGLPVELRAASGPHAVRMWYRRFNQAERYEVADMQREGTTWHALVPADYTRTPYPIQYYFEVRSAAGVALWPGFGSDFKDRPYFVSQPG